MGKGSQSAAHPLEESGILVDRVTSAEVEDATGVVSQDALYGVGLKGLLVANQSRKALPGAQPFGVLLVVADFFVVVEAEEVEGDLGNGEPFGQEPADGGFAGRRGR